MEMAELVQPNDVTELVAIFANSVFDNTTGDPEKTRMYAEIQQKCVDLFAKDYVVKVIDNEKGSLSPTYPNRIVSLAFPVRSPEGSTAYRAAHALRTRKLRGHMARARSARAHKRFAVPVILYDGKHICRSATLSSGLEIYWRTVLEFLGISDRERGEESESASEKEAELCQYSGAVSSYDVAIGEARPVLDEPSTPRKESVSPLTKADSSRHSELRMEDILLLRELSVGQICDFMVEGKKEKYSVKVSSSEKVDKWNRYRDFTIFKLPYPGCEFFEEFKAKGYNAEGLVFGWNQNFVNVELEVPKDQFASELGIDWAAYKEWDLVQLTKNYLKYLLKVVFDGSSGLLVHCICGWDRTPLFIAMLRLSLWADGAIHQNLSAVEIAYLTVAYDWFLFCHDLPNRVNKSEEIFFFCFNMLKYIDTEDFSVLTLKTRKDDLEMSDSNIQSTHLGEQELDVGTSYTARESGSASGWDLGEPSVYFQVPSDSTEQRSFDHGAGVRIGGEDASSAKSSDEDDSAVVVPSTGAAASPWDTLSVRQRHTSGCSSFGDGSWQVVNETGSVGGSPPSLLSRRKYGRSQSPSPRSRPDILEKPTDTSSKLLSSAELLQRRRERLEAVRRMVSRPYQSIVADKTNRRAGRRPSSWTRRLLSIARALFPGGGCF
ncbi:phosphatidylinositol-3,5-bisphosphate 3-phosphatase MTMR14-like [Amblyomma americanum]